MALKAGYYGIKKALIDMLNGAKIIKTIGSGLSLSDAGSLSVKNGDFLGFDDNGKLDVLIGNGLGSDESDNLSVKLGNGLDFDESNQVAVKLGDGLDFDENGAIKSTSSGGAASYSTTEADTGMTWTNGDKIYKRTYTGWSLGVALQDSWKALTSSQVDNISSIKRVIMCEGEVTLRSSSTDWYGYIPMACIKDGNDLKIKADATSGTPVNVTGMTLYYTKN